MVIYTILNLKQYKDQVERQKEVLQLSTKISDKCKTELTETYDLQLSIATKELQQITNGIDVDFELLSHL